LGLGVPTPRAATTVATLATAGRCESVRLDDLPRQVLRAHDVTGDLLAVAQVRAQIDNPVTRARYERLLRGTVIQPAVQSFVAAMTDGRVTHDAGIVMAAGDAVLEDVSGLGFASDQPTNPPRPAWRGADQPSVLQQRHAGDRNRHALTSLGLLL
jgi:hypothetical protein